MGFKTWSAGDVLTASDVNTYLGKQAVIVCTSSTRPSSPVEGMTIYETDTDLVQIYNGSSWLPAIGLSSVIGLGQTGMVVKSANETASNSTTLHNDVALSLSLTASANYKFDALIFYEAGTTADFKFAFTLPSDATISFLVSTMLTTGGTQTFSTQAAYTTGTAIASGGLGIGTVVGLQVFGSIRMSTTAGTLQLQWAQNTAVVENTAVKIGSTLSLVRTS